MNAKIVYLHVNILPLCLVETSCLRQRKISVHFLVEYDRIEDMMKLGKLKSFCKVNFSLFTVTMMILNYGKQPNMSLTE